MGSFSLEVSAPNEATRYFQHHVEPGRDTPEEGPTDRDKDARAVARLNRTVRPHETKHFKDLMVIDRIATHSAYWRQGHATDITKWVVSLADMDGVSMGVAGAPMGRTFFAKHGFKEGGGNEIPGSEAHNDSVCVWLGVREERKIEL